MKRRDVRLTTGAHREAFDGFYDAFRDVGGREGWRSSEVLRHFLEAAYRAVRGRVLRGDAWRSNEDEFLKEESRWRDRDRTKTSFAQMLGCLALALAREPVDFVGPVFSEIAADEWMGQFFTPHELSLLIAKMTFGDSREKILGGKPYVTISEPACGVGGMVLAANVALREAGIDVARETYWHAVDVDARAFHACYLQLALTDVSAVVVNGNTLALSAWQVASTPAALAYPKSFEPKHPERALSADLQPQTQLSLPGFR